MCVFIYLDARTLTRSLSCTVRTAAGATLTRKAPRPRWARWWRLTAWPTTGAPTAAWLWASRGVRSSAAQGPIWSGPTPWTAPPLTLQRRSPGLLLQRYNKTQRSNPPHTLSVTVPLMFGLSREQNRDQSHHGNFHTSRFGSSRYSVSSKTLRLQNQLERILKGDWLLRRIK